MRISDWSSDVCSSDLAHEEHLRGHEDEGEAEDAEHLEGHPEVGRLSTPDSLVQGRHGEEEKSKAQRELVPASFVEGPGGAQQRHQQRLPERQAAASSEERRVGKECGSTWRSRWSPYP